MAIEDGRPRESGLDALELGRLRGQGGTFRAALIGAAIAFLAVFLPWTNGDNYGDLIFGSETDQGKFFLLALLGFAYAMWRYAEDYRAIRLVAAALAAAVFFLGGVAELLSIEIVPDRLGIALAEDGNPPSVQSGWGLWIYLAGAALAAIATALMVRDEVRRAGTASPSDRGHERPPA